MKPRNVLVFLGVMVISMVAMSFFHYMPQKMFEMGSQMVSPSQNPKTVCECKCN